MFNRKMYERKLPAASAWMLKAIALIVAGAAAVILAVTIKKGVSITSDSPPGGKFVGVRHEAAAVPENTDRGQHAAPNTVVRNGITFVSPQLLVPVIDIDSMRATSGSGDHASAPENSTARKRSHTRSQKRIANTRWKAYGLALR